MFDRAREALARRLPWWALVLAGLLAVALSARLLVSPRVALSTLAYVVATGLVVHGIVDVASAETDARPPLSRVAGAFAIGSGLASAAWPGISIGVLALVVGLALVASGAAKAVEAWHRFAPERPLTLLSGVTNVLFGVVALSWPGVTVLVLGVVFGGGIGLLGLRLLWLGVSLRRRRQRDPERAATEYGLTPASSADRRGASAGTVIAKVATFAVAIAATVASVAVHRAQPGDPPSFYRPPAAIPDAAEPGTILRSEVVEGYATGATTYRVLYVSTGIDGEPVATSGLILVPEAAIPEGGRNVLAYTHGTVGTASRCAPSLVAASSNPLFHEGGQRFLDAGYVIVAPDYLGLGTPGPHPYLVGAVEARNTLDAVRAARKLPAARASNSFAVWGHSQGGRAALFTGQVAAEGYASDLRLVGVAAGGPVPDLEELFKVNLETTVGKVLIAMALDAWAEVYDTAELAQIVEPAARPVVARIARNCLYGQGQLLGSLPGALLLDLVFLRRPVWDTEPWRTIAAENDPGQAPTSVPMLVVQGTADSIVSPAVTDRFVDRRCAAGEAVAYLTLPGIGHVETGHDAADEVFDWVEGRFAGQPATSTC